jgi:hypothetical protein
VLSLEWTGNVNALSSVARSVERRRCPARLSLSLKNKLTSAKILSGEKSSSITLRKRMSQVPTRKKS